MLKSHIFHRKFRGIWPQLREIPANRWEPIHSLNAWKVLTTYAIIGGDLSKKIAITISKRLAKFGVQLPIKKKEIVWECLGPFESQVLRRVRTPPARRQRAPQLRGRALHLRPRGIRFAAASAAEGGLEPRGRS